MGQLAEIASKRMTKISETMPPAGISLIDCMLSAALRPTYYDNQNRPCSQKRASGAHKNDV
jgi:hypothetical protein